jgi:hypothetical protein
MFAPYRFDRCASTKTSAGFASGQGFFVGITPAVTGRMVGCLSEGHDGVQLDQIGQMVI